MNDKNFSLSKGELEALCNSARERVLESDSTLSEADERELRAIIEELEDKITEYERLRLRVGTMLDYNQLKKNGFKPEQLRAFEKKDVGYVEQVERYYSENLQKRQYMFGYPANMEDYSYATSYLRHLESKMYLMNNCGDPYQKGNYGMDSKSTEKRIIKLVASNFGIDEGNYWGYITSGGTESNFWGIREGFNRLPEGKLYFSEGTHYSVEKYVFDGERRDRYPYEIIPTDSYGRISVEALTAAVKRDREAGIRGAILVLTWGTTCYGALDDVKKVTDEMKALGVDYYCHLDAAHFGGIAKNQKNAPYVEGLCELGVDSVAVSMHKFMGTARVNGVLLALSRRDRPIIDYIGQEDSTFLGSRDYLPFSTYQRASEMLLRREPEHFCTNVVYFEEQLRRAGVEFTRFERSNTFIIDRPNDEICKKYQLATFVDRDGEQKAHVIIFPFHKKEIMDELVHQLRGQEF